MDDVALAITAAREGAAVVRAHFATAREERPVHLKARFNPVTAADLESERAIVDTLRTARPDDGVLAEEGSGEAARGRRWIVDPLDGTVNFVHGIPQLGVSVALYEDDRALAAVTIDPIRNEEFVAVAGGGASCNGSPISVSETADPARAVIATGFPYDHDRRAPEYAAVLAAVLAEVNGVRRFGSAVLDLAWLAAGRYDGFWELGLAPWDVAAGILLVHEAGGIVTDPEGTPSTPERGLVVAANPALHPFLRETVQTAWG